MKNRNLRKLLLQIVISGLFAIAVLQQSILCASAKPFVSRLAPKAHLQAESQAEYRIKPRDILDIRIEGECIYSTDFEVDERGRISMAFIDEIQAAGRTVAELETNIAKKLSKYLKEPKVKIRLIEKST